MRENGSRSWRCRRSGFRLAPVRLAPAPHLSAKQVSQHSCLLDLLEHLEDALGRAIEQALESLAQATTLERVATGAFTFCHVYLRNLGSEFAQCGGPANSARLRSTQDSSGNSPCRSRTLGKRLVCVTPWHRECCAAMHWMWAKCPHMQSFHARPNPARNGSPTRVARRATIAGGKRLPFAPGPFLAKRPACTSPFPLSAPRRADD